MSLSLEAMDLRQFDLNRKFDACLCMFAVLGYLTETGDIISTFKNIRRHLGKNSLFVFDFWNGLAVLRILPSERIKVIEDMGKRIIRTARPELDAFNHLCRVHYNLTVTRDNTITSEFKETHTVRYFFPQEITHYLEESGFDVIKMCPFLDLNGRVDENEWNVIAIAKAI